MKDTWPWLILALLGVYHGINPAMGWLFAVALGLQERNRTAVLRAFTPIVLGHTASVTTVVALLIAAQAIVAPEVLRLTSAGTLLVFGVYKLLVAKHPRWVGMRVNFRDLTAWSFLMSTAHGVGLMLMPIQLRLASTAVEQAALGQAIHMAAKHAHHISTVVAPVSVLPATLMAVALHTAAMFLTMGLIALIVYEKVGLAILRRAWFNLDLIWAVALTMAGGLSFAI
jgi:hypothetical protein